MIDTTERNLHRKYFGWIVFLKFNLCFSRNFRQQNKPGNNVVLCFMRIAFVVMIILLVIMALLTGIYYALDLAMQSTCRTVHDDQPFLINLMSGK